jgi:hypothetical protein
LAYKYRSIIILFTSLCLVVYYSVSVTLDDIVVVQVNILRTIQLVDFVAFIQFRVYVAIINLDYDLIVEFLEDRSCLLIFLLDDEHACLA